MSRQRLDALLVSRGLAETRNRAQALILAGKVYVGGKKSEKAGLKLTDDAEIAVRGDDGWASRGAYKLLGALDGDGAFAGLRERIAGADCWDIGASTGGFTDVLLRHGAARVIALDVGYGQLHWRIRSDTRVLVMDRTNVRNVAVGDLPFRPTLATCDASFISVTRFLDVVFRELAPGGWFVVLVKPQFEVGRDEVGKGGIVRDEKLRQRALSDVRQAARRVGFEDLAAQDSALAGPKGNREFVLLLQKPDASVTAQVEPRAVVE